MVPTSLRQGKQKAAATQTYCYGLVGVEGAAEVVVAGGGGTAGFGLGMLGASGTSSSGLVSGTSTFT
jgi:hypothetical protein